MRPDSLLGKTFDEYRIEKPLGAGGMAKVYRALDMKLNRYVALKVVAAEHRADPTYTQRFEREAQSIARLEHPNIIQIHRFGEANGLYYIIMQYVDGADLDWLIQDYKSAGEVMPIGDVVRVMQEIGAALDYAHSREVIHRDVKPSNILVDNRGRAMLTDFGLALAADVGTQGEIFGSPQYNAPEQVISSANVVPQSDIYSLGITLFEMLSGEVPFIADDPVELSMRHVRDVPPAPSQFNAAIPPAVDEIVLRALEKEPFNRYQTCAEFAHVLQDAIENSWSSSRPTTASSRRPSLVLLPQKVHAHIQTPPVPIVDMTPDSTVAGAPMPVPPPATTIRRTPTPRSSWKRALAFAGCLFLVGIAFIFILVKLPNFATIQPSEFLPNLAPIATRTSILQIIASSTPIPNPTLTSIPLHPIQQLSNPTTIPVTFVPIVIQPTTIILAPTEVPEQYDLLIARNKDQSLFIVNIGLYSVPLNGLRISSNRGSVEGAEWQVDQLHNGSCVSIWKSDRHATKPDVDCSEVGDHLTRNSRDVFWKSSYSIYYNDLSVATCDQDTCLVQISGH